ncbi:MAG: polysaccharide biosynthesis protein [Lachnospiraceae bacterium]|jgi:stage V sporulation protein B|nr:polysaccharide biosynthesis protein [Lachnospiraceae bacterium]MCI9682418.1 polysaccharide biosynthesis protein [Lachnospiraceae bacterium]
MKKQKHPLIAGTLILTLTGLASRFIGFFYKIFLSRTIGAEGIGIYQMIFPIYGVCYALTTAGAEIAISRFVSGEIARGKKEQARSILWIGLSMSLALSLFTTLTVYLNADLIALRLLHEARCANLLRIMSITVPFGACHSCVSGYYYGLQKTAVPACAQLFEQLVRVAAVYIIYQVSLEEGLTLSPAAAVIGLVLGEFASMLFTLFAISSESLRTRTQKAAVFPTRSYAKRMFREAAPVSANRVCMNLLGSAEAILLPLTLQQYGLTVERALSVYGTLTGMAMAFIQFPSVLTNAVSVMLLSSVSESQAAGNQNQIARTIRKTIRFCLPLGIACTVFFLLTGKTLGTFFFKNPMAGDFIITLAWICPFLYLNSTLHSILNGLGRTAAGFINNLIGVMIRIFFILTFVPRFGIQGYLWGILSNQLFVAFLNVNALKEERMLTK